MRYLVIILIGCLSAQAVPTGFKQDDSLSYGLVGWWTFNEGAGTNVFDSSGGGSNGSLSNSPTWGKGIIGSSLFYNGTTQKTTVPNNARLGITNGSITLAAWINVTNSGNVRQIVNLRNTVNNSTSYGLCLSIANNSIQFYYTTNHVFNVFSQTTPVIVNGTNYHVAATYTFGLSNSCKLFLNGTDATGSWIAGTGAALNSDTITTELSIGSLNPPSGDLFAGMIDDVRIYNRALTTNEIKTLYGGGYGVQ